MTVYSSPDACQQRIKELEQERLEYLTYLEDPPNPKRVRQVRTLFNLCTDELGELRGVLDSMLGGDE